MMAPPPRFSRAGIAWRGAQQVAAQIDRHRPVPNLERQIDSVRIVQAERQIGGVGVHQVDAAIGFDSGLYQGTNRCIVTDIEASRDRRAVRRRYFRHGILRSLDIDVADDDRDAFFGQPDGGGCADSRSAAGDDRDLALESTHSPDPLYRDIRLAVIVGRGADFSR